MQFIETPLAGAYLLRPNVHPDERGFFSRLFCQKEFADRSLEICFVQGNHSLSTQKGTLRGLHYQLFPMEEAKLVRCTRGSVYDVILDLRKESPTFGSSFGAELSDNNYLMMYVPKGFAHGFLSLSENSEIFYLVSQFYSKELERGVRWNDPQFSISWPEKPRVISEKDQNHPDYARVIKSYETV